MVLFIDFKNFKKIFTLIKNTRIRLLYKTPKKPITPRSFFGKNANSTWQCEVFDVAPIREFFYASADGLKLYCRDFETRASESLTPVLCLPGLTRNSRDFETLAEHLNRQGHRVLTPDLRGRGKSGHDRNWHNYQPAIYAADLWKLLDELNTERCAIIGTSLGALLAMLMAAQQPQRIAGIVLNDAGPEIAREGLERIARYTGLHSAVESWEQAAAQAEATYGAALPGLSPAQWMAYARRAYRENAEGRPEPDMDPNIGTALRANSDANAPDLWPLYAQLRDKPTLAIRGATSDILSAETFARMAREKPDLYQVTVPDRGHAPLLDEPESLRAIDDFLAELK